MYPGERNHKETTDLESSLKDCQAVARRGYEIAKYNLRESSEAIQVLSKSLLEFLKTLDSGTVRTTGILENLREQLVSVMTELGELQDFTTHNLEERYKRLEKFSITLFGRTMVGKSTLMEILTNGNGDSIGSGAQRTTRDVRPYHWKGMEVIDVPGVAAFEGVEDEKLALKSASESDLVLFLMTDDAPQPEEGKFLAKVWRLGKPVLGICNVKVAVDDIDNEEDRLLFFRDLDRCLHSDRIERLINQFYEFTNQYMPGKRIPFIRTHLRSRFLAQQADYSQYREDLLDKSNFWDVEAQIIQEVTKRGTFLRTKSFIDAIAAPMLNQNKIFLEFSTQNADSGRVYTKKHDQLRVEVQRFKEEGHVDIKVEVSRMMNCLRNKVPSFSENHYENKRVGREWDSIVSSLGINAKSEKLQKRIWEKGQLILREVSRELKAELSFVSTFSSDRKISTEKIFDAKKVMGWAGGILSALLLFTPVGWVGAGAVGVISGLVSFFFDDREKKVKQARKELSSKLEDNITDMERKLLQRLNGWFDQEVLQKQVESVCDDLEVVASGFSKLAEEQRRLAEGLNDRQKALARSLITEALQHLNCVEVLDGICEVARIPGVISMIIRRPKHKIFSHVREGLQELLGEQIYISPVCSDHKPMIAWSLERENELDLVTIDNENRIASVAIDKISPLAQERILLIQQITGLHVMKGTA